MEGIKLRKEKSYERDKAMEEENIWKGTAIGWTKLCRGQSYGRANYVYQNSGNKSELETR